MLGLEEDENRIKLGNDRLHESEKRNASILKEIDSMRSELDELRQQNNKYQKGNIDQKDQIRVLNENLKREAEISRARESEARIHGEENRTLKKLLEESRSDYGAYKNDQSRLIDNLRLQLDETKEMIDRIRETKDREMRRQRDKLEDEKRKETEKYQFEYDKLREEIQLFARKLGQEENLNKQLSMLNYKLQNNINELGNNFSSGRDEDYLSRDRNYFHPSGALDVDNDTNDEIFNRKKAWAELEREQDEVKSNIKSLMRKAPESNVIENPLLADRIQPSESKQNYRVPQDVILEKKHKNQMEDIKKERQSSQSQDRARSSKPTSSKPVADKSSKMNREKSNEQLLRSKDKLNKDRSNEDLSMSS